MSCSYLNAFKGTVLNRALTSLHGWSLEIKRTVPLILFFLLKISTLKLSMYICRPSPSRIFIESSFMFVLHQEKEVLVCILEYQ